MKLSKLKTTTKPLAIMLMVTILAVTGVRYFEYSHNPLISADTIEVSDDSLLAHALTGDEVPTAWTPVLATLAKVAAATAAVAAAAAAAAKAVQTVDDLIENIQELAEWDQAEGQEVVNEASGPSEMNEFPILMSQSSNYSGLTFEEAEYMSQF